MLDGISLKLQLAAVGVAAALASAGCGMMAPKAEQYVTPPDGTTWVQMRRDTGSYGSGSSQVQFTFLGRRTWQGREMSAFESEGVTTMMIPVVASFAAMLKGGNPMISWDPPAGWEWPLEVGKTWTKKSVVTIHAAKRSIPYEYTQTVEAHEEVTVPAGTLKVFRIKTVDTLGNENVQWFSSELSVFAKQSLRRTAKHAQGAGTREVELVSHTRAR